MSGRGGARGGGADKAPAEDRGGIPEGRGEGQSLRAADLSTVSSPPLLINYSSSTKSPPSLTSPSSSVSVSVLESASASDLPRPPPPPGDGVVPTVEVVNCKPRYMPHEEAAVQVEGAGLVLILMCMYPLCKVEGAGILLVHVRMYPLCTVE